MAERRINDRTYRYDRRPGPDGLRVLLKGLKVLLPAQALIACILADDAEREALEGPAFVELILLMDDAAIHAFVTDLVSQAYDNGRLIADTMGVMMPDELLAVALFCLQVEFAWVFSTGVGSAFRRATEAVREHGMAARAGLAFPGGVVAGSAPARAG